MATTATNTDVQDIDLDAMLADLDLEEAAVEAAAEEAQAKKEPVDDDLDGLLEELELETAPASTEEVNLDELEALLDEPAPAAKKPAKKAAKKAEKKSAPKKDNSDLYAEDEADVSVDAAPATKTDEVEENKKQAKKAEAEDEVKKPAKAKKAKAEGEKKESKPKAAKVDPGLPASEQLMARLGESGKGLLELEDGVELSMAVVDAMPKKVKEKLHNLFAHLHTGTTVSTYTSRGLDLIVKNGEASTAELIADYQEKWSKGTSSSQVGQIVRLFKDLKICNVEGKTLSPNKKSKLLPLLTAIETEA